jgi:hypothetical protein
VCVRDFQVDLIYVFSQVGREKSENFKSHLRAEVVEAVWITFGAADTGIEFAGRWQKTRTFPKFFELFASRASIAVAILTFPSMDTLAQ